MAGRAATKRAIVGPLFEHTIHCKLLLRMCYKLMDYTSKINLRKVNIIIIPVISYTLRMLVHKMTRILLSFILYNDYPAPDQLIILYS